MPIVHGLEEDGVATFRFVQGTYEVPPPRGYAEFFGPPPHYSFCTDFSVADMEVHGISQFSEQIGDTPEDTIRNLLPLNMIKVNKEGYLEDMERLNQILESEGPFDAVLGFSHGACVAATLLDDNMRRSKAQGIPSMFKMGIFLCGLPPYNMEQGGMLLADVDGEVFKLPTIHVIGSSDPLIDCALALYNLCDPDTAVLFDHGKGHQLIW